MGWEEIFSQTGETGGDQFGESVAISGNYAIVGAYAFDGSKGKAYWYERQRDGKWVQVQTQQGEAANDSFGWSVAISGNYAIVGAYGFDGRKGKAYWYERQRDGKWREVHTQTGEAAVDQFGWSVAISGNYSIVGAPDFGTDDEGKAYWYQRQKDGKWREVHTQLGENGAAEVDEGFAGIVAISGNYAVVGSFMYEDDLLKIYQRNNFGKWVEIQKLNFTKVNDCFIDGNYLTIGDQAQERFYIYERKNNGKWEEVFLKPESSSLETGKSVSVSGSYIVSSNDTENKIFWSQRKNNGNWEQIQVVDKTNIKAVAVSGNYSIFGGNNNIHIYQRYL